MANVTICNTTLEQLPSESWSLAFGIMIAVVSVVATFENGIVLLLFYVNASLRTTSNTIIASIVAADFFTGSIVGPLYSAQLMDENFNHDCFAHKLRRLLGIVFMGSSLASILFISIDRSHRLIRLQKYSMQRRLLYGLLLLCWLVPLSMALLGLIDEDVHSTIISIVGGFVIAGMITCYVIVIMALKSHRRKKMDKKNAKYMKNEQRAGRTVIWILTCFVVMLLPMFIEKGLYSINVLRANSPERSLTHMFSIWLFIANSIVNPVIYCSRIPAIRKQLLVLMGILKKPLSRSTESRSGLSTPTQDRFGSRASSRTPPQVRLGYIAAVNTPSQDRLLKDQKSILDTKL